MLERVSSICIDPFLSFLSYIWSGFCFRNLLSDEGVGVFISGEFLIPVHEHKSTITAIRRYLGRKKVV